MVFTMEESRATRVLADHQPESTRLLPPGFLRDEWYLILSHLQNHFTLLQFEIFVSDRTFHSVLFCLVLPPSPAESGRCGSIFYFFAAEVKSSLCAKKGKKRNSV